MTTTIPAGWKLVPLEPTDEMEAAAEDDYEQRGETFPDWKAKYRAMLAAAPASPVSTVEQGEAQPWPAGLLERVKAAEQRIRDGHGSMRIPADPTDPDLVLAEVAALIEGRTPPFWLRPAPAAGDAQTEAARDVLAERQRQQEKEGFNDENDDNYCGDLATAGAAYALNAAENISAFRESNENDASPEFWPWPNRWWKPTTPRRDLVKACALILAEIERLDRAAQRQGDA